MRMFALFSGSDNSLNLNISLNSIVGASNKHDGSKGRRLNGSEGRSSSFSTSFSERGGHVLDSLLFQADL
jgi:hypothetical protein